MLGLIIRTGRSTLDGGIVARLQLIVGIGLIARIGLIVEEVAIGGGFGWGINNLDTFGVGDSIIDHIFVLRPKLWLVIIR